MNPKKCLLNSVILFFLTLVVAPRLLADTISGTGWKGTANNRWSGANWDSNPPTTTSANERNLFFGLGYKVAGGSGSTISSNDLASWAGYRITFQDSNATGTAGDGSAANDTSFTIKGNSFTLFDFGGSNFPKIENLSYVDQTFDLNAGGVISLSSGVSGNKAEIDPTNGNLIFSANTGLALLNSTQLEIWGSNQCSDLNL